MGNHVRGTIKPLEWIGDESECFMRCDTDFGEYQVWVQYGDEWTASYTPPIGREMVLHVHGYAHSAKSAAQADYEARIAAQIQPDDSSVTDLLVRVCTDAVTDANEDNSGFWRSCSGCHELNEGVPTGPYHPGLKCYIGLGCHECGGIGATWDTTHYTDMGEFLDNNTPQADPSSEAGELVSREAAVSAARSRHKHWAELGSKCLVDDDISACEDIAEAIRALPAAPFPPPAKHKEQE